MALRFKVPPGVINAVLRAGAAAAKEALGDLFEALEEDSPGGRQITGMEVQRLALAASDAFRATLVKELTRLLLPPALGGERIPPPTKKRRRARKRSR